MKHIAKELLAFRELSFFNPLNTNRWLLYLKTQFVPRSKHFPPRLEKQIS